MKTIAINLFGGPGTGKTILAPRIFSELNIGKPFGEATYVMEYAKELVYANNMALLADQRHVTQEQCRRMRIYADKVGVVVTDSPILLGKIYSPAHQLDDVSAMIAETENLFFNVNIFLTRIDEALYDPVGRLQTHNEAMDIDQKILKELIDTGREYVIVANKFDIASVVKHVAEVVYEASHHLKNNNDRLFGDTEKIESKPPSV